VDVTASYVEAALAAWGIWLRQGGGGAAGYPSHTAEGRLRRDGTLIRGSGGRVLTDDSLAERVDRIVARLAMDDRRLPFVLRRYWGSEGATYDTVAQAVRAEYGDKVSADGVRKWMRESAVYIRGELRAHSLHASLDNRSGASY
jgi:hypothetical protein